MGRYLLKVAVQFRQQDDGSWMAKSAEVPIFVVAPTREELDRRADSALRTFADHLGRNRPPNQEIQDYLQELGVPYEWDPSEGAATDETVTMPVPVPI